MGRLISNEPREVFRLIKLFHVLMVVVVITTISGNGSYLSRLIELSPKILLLPAPAKKKQLKILRKIQKIPVHYHMNEKLRNLQPHTVLGRDH